MPIQFRKSAFLITLTVFMGCSLVLVWIGACIAKREQDFVSDKFKLAERECKELEAEIENLEIEKARFQKPEWLRKSADAMIAQFHPGQRFVTTRRGEGGYIAVSRFPVLGEPILPGSTPDSSGRVVAADTGTSTTQFSPRR